MRAFSAPAKRLRNDVKLVASALPPWAALWRHLYLRLSPIEPGGSTVQSPPDTVHTERTTENQNDDQGPDHPRSRLPCSSSSPLIAPIVRTPTSAIRYSTHCTAYATQIFCSERKSLHICGLSCVESGTGCTGAPTSEMYCVAVRSSHIALHARAVIINMKAHVSNHKIQGTYQLLNNLNSVQRFSLQTLLKFPTRFQQQPFSLWHMMPSKYKWMPEPHPQPNFAHLRETPAKRCRLVAAAMAKSTLTWSSSKFAISACSLSDTMRTNRGHACT